MENHFYHIRLPPLTVTILRKCVHCVLGATSMGPMESTVYLQMITSVRFCLSYDALNVTLSPSKFVYFNEKLHCCHESVMLQVPITLFMK